MSKFTSPAFQFYPRDWLSDSKVLSMTASERGIYITLLCFCWLDKTIPDDIPQLAQLCGISVAEMEASWPAVKRCFKKANPTGRLYNKRLAQERKAQKQRTASHSAAGEKGAKKRWNKSNDTKQVDSPAISLPMAIDSSSSSTSSSIAPNSPPIAPQGGQFSLSSQSEISSSENGKKRFDAGEFFEAEFWPQVWVKKGKGGALRSFKRVARSKTAADKIRDAAIQQGPILMDRVRS
jgi:uncharacterized protein YdaU (DUF1376 family)